MLTPSNLVTNLKIKVFHQAPMHCVQLCDTVFLRGTLLEPIITLI